MATLESAKKSLNAYKGHFTRAAKAFDSLLKVEPFPTVHTIEKAYLRVQNQLDTLLNSLDHVISLIESQDTTNSLVENLEDTSKVLPDTDKETQDLNAYHEYLVVQQHDIEARYVRFRESMDNTTRTTESVPRSLLTVPSNSKVRLTALNPPSWNGAKADFYTWQRKFIHIMAEAKLNDELTQLCYLQSSGVLPSEYQVLISDCSTIGEVWSRLEERVPKEIIKHEIISQFRSLKPITSKRTPEILRNFANEISLFCRRMSDIGIRKENYSCIIIQDIYERLGHDITMRYRSKIQLIRELNGHYTDRLQ